MSIRSYIKKNRRQSSIAYSTICSGATSLNTPQLAAGSFIFENVLIYCDPPYMLDARHGKQYRHEMSTGNHEELLSLLLKHKGPVVISGYETELYNNMLAGWNRYETTSYSQVCSKKREVLWMNYDPPARQMNFDDYAGAL